MSVDKTPLSPGVRLANSLPLRPQPVSKIEWSPDGHLLAVCYDELIQIWDVDARLAIHGFTTPGTVLDCAWTFDGETFAYLSATALVFFSMASKSAEAVLPAQYRFEGPGDQDSAIGKIATLLQELGASGGARMVSIGAVPGEAIVTAYFSVGMSIDLDAVSGEPLSARSPGNQPGLVQSLEDHLFADRESVRVDNDSIGDVTRALLSITGRQSQIKEWYAQVREVAPDLQDMEIVPSGQLTLRAVVRKGRFAWTPEGSAGASLYLGHVSIHPADSDVSASAVTELVKISDIAWHPSAKTLIVAVEDATLQYWDLLDAKVEEVLEGHADAVIGVSISADGRLLASKSMDGTIRIWRFDKRDTVAVIDERAQSRQMAPLAFHPALPLLASVDGDQTRVSIWELDVAYLTDSAPLSDTVHYVNAKIVLIGDTGVGKSGLAQVLTGQPFTPTFSTHGRQVWDFEKQTLWNKQGQVETHEAVLWDFAGQPGYRIVHQLHLKDVAVALVVFDARDERDPFAGVRHWSSALQKVHSVRGDETFPMHKLLVAARADRGRVSVSPERIEQMVKDGGYDGFIETSAKEGWNIKELATMIRVAIDWDDLPRVSSTRLFTIIKNYLVEQKNSGMLLASVSDLYKGFLNSGSAQPDGEELRDQFDVCVGRVEAVDLVRRLSFGDLLLLKPELLDAYASALVNAAREQPDGLGFVEEDKAKAGDFLMSDDERVQDADLERLLLIATVEDLLWHEIALREVSEDGALLVFPSQLTRENPNLPDPPGKFVTFRFVGPLQSIYAALVVRLGRSLLFTHDKLWRNAAEFTATAGGWCGLYMELLDEDLGEITLFSSDGASEETMFHFENYVCKHLLGRAAVDQVERRRLFICPKCKVPVTDTQATMRRELGFDWIRCPICESPISLKDGLERLESPPRPGHVRMDEAAEIERHRQTVETTLQGNVETGALYERLYKLFDLDEVEELAFLLDVEYQDVRRRSKKQTVIALIKYMERRSRLVDLLNAAMEKRPNADWSSVQPGRLPL